MRTIAEGVKTGEDDRRSERRMKNLGVANTGALGGAQVKASKTKSITEESLTREGQPVV